MRPLDRRLLPHLRPARAALGGVVAAGAAGGVLLVAQAFAVADLLTDALGGRPLAGSATLLGLVVLGRALAGWAGERCASAAAARVGRALRRRVVAAALALGPAALSRHRTGELALLATRGVSAVEPYLTRYLPALVLGVLLPPVTVLAILAEDLRAGLVVLLTLPLVPVFAALVGMATRDRADRQWRLLSSLAGHFLDVVRGLPTLVVHDRARFQGERIREVTHRYRRAGVETLRIAFASSAVLELVATLSVALVAVLVGLRLASGSLDLHTALVVLLLAPEAYWPLRRVGAEFHAAAEGTATFEEVDRLAREAAESGGHAPTGTGAGDGPEDGIDVRRLTVRYPGRTVPALDGVTVHVPPRGITAVTGPSGCGKSTLLAAVLGHVEAESGSVTVRGRTGPDRQELVAWVPQRPWLLPGSVRDNVRLGRPDADDAAIWQVLELVRLADHVATLPEGLDAEVTEDGASLSAGERARLVLARAVLSDRPWVVLDEPTAHLDAATEAALADALVHLARTRGVLLVAHRPALVEIADHVIALPAPADHPAEDPARLPADDRPAPVPTDHHAAAAAAAAAAEPGPGGPVKAPAAGVATAPTPAPSSAVDRSGVRRRLVAGTVLGSLAAASGVALTATAGWLIVRAAEQPPVLVLLVAIVGVRTFGLARPALRYVERLVSHDAALRLLADRRVRVYDDLVPLTPGRLGRQRGDVLAGVVDDVDAVLDQELRVRAPLAVAGVVGTGAVLLAWLLAPGTPAVAATVAGVLVVAGPVAGGLAFLGARSGERLFIEARAAASSWVTAVLQGAADLTVWAAVPAALDRVDRASDAVAAGSRRAGAGLAAGRALAVLGGGLGTVAAVAAGAPAYARGDLSGPVLALLALLPLALVEVLLPVADAGALVVRTRAAAARLDRLHRTVPAVTEPADPAPAPRSAELVLDRVSAGWGGRPALRDLDVRLPVGTRLGVVGPSGSGKSTLAACLLRFLDPDHGEVQMAGTALPRLSLHEVRRQVGLIDDDPHVFSTSLAENVRLARPEASDTEVEGALRAAHLGPFLDALPLGLATVLGEGHAAVSGGERARLGLARALLADRPVLVLDEPTAHLDAGTARAVSDDLLGRTGPTLVWITHSPIGLDRMDAVLDLGPDAAAVRTTSVSRSGGSG
ncbi:thiol reductant ABC exporter subunit CydD [Nocardioides mesophilus]|uniref:Thiol reductant ABC exporter subunit CydD n=1 Tax=Nocardioides mesophilus TaxID=433659 RepID=A0A7G9R9G0_9ACTN|nr:thiol reductant ABC exporter subunit CydD [Nocardioides mesophilus]QNN52235.1 thiol reductant ABC exporter subunit CydD [Nocardioides mesophilus]